VTSVTVEKDHIYATIGDTVLGLDLYRAPMTAAPVVVHVHGGGWRSGDKADGAAERLAALAAYGVTVASVNYRLVPAASLPAQLHDVKGAVRWLRANAARLGIPSDHIGMWGASAGAYLASLLALTPHDDDLEGDVGGNLEYASDVHAVVHWFGQSDLLASGSRTAAEARLLPFAFEAGVLGVEHVADAGNRARTFGLLHRVSADAPPFLIAHGDRDHIVAPSESESLHAALSRAGADTTFLLVGGEGHEGPKFDQPAMLSMTAAWLRAKLVVAPSTGQG
jgi:acetyl esterase/lipase